MIGLVCLLLLFLSEQAWHNGFIVTSCAVLCLTAIILHNELHLKFCSQRFVDMPQKLGPWEWFVEKVLPGLFLTVAVGVGGASFAVWKGVSELTNAVKDHEKRLERIEVQQQNLVTRAELLETLKRVEQQMQIVLLQSGIKTKVEIR
jgi:hypothetical protein